MKSKKKNKKKGIFISISYPLFHHLTFHFFRIRKPVQRDPLPELPSKKSTKKGGSKKKVVEPSKTTKKNTKSGSTTPGSKKPSTPAKVMTPASKKKKIAELEKKVSLFSFFFVLVSNLYFLFFISGV